MGYGWDKIDVKVNSVEARDKFIAIFNKELKKEFYWSGCAFVESDFKLEKSTYHAQVAEEPLFKHSVVNEVLEAMQKFIIEFPSVKYSSSHDYDDCGDRGYVKCKYNKNLLTITRKDPYKAKEVKSYELVDSVWRVKEDLTNV